MGPGRRGAARAVTGHSHRVLAVALGPEGRYLATGSADEAARLWETATGERLRSFEHPDWVRSVVFSSDGRTVFTACEDGRLHVWDVETGERLLASGGSDGKIKVWDPRTGDPLQVLPGHRGGAEAVSFAPGGPGGGRLLASAGWDRAIKLWEREEPREDEAARPAPRPGNVGQPGPLPPGPPDRPSDLPS